MSRFTDRVVIVTGGASGIGRATVEQFANEGANVVIADLKSSAGQEVEQTLSTEKKSCRFIPTDITDEEQIRNLVAKTVDEFGTIDVLVNNAVVFITQGIDASAADWKRSFDVNVIGSATVTKHVVPIMQAKKRGAIVNMGSISSFLAQPEFMTYNTTKAAMASMTRCLALDLAPFNIRVNAVCPGTIWTPIVEKMSREKGLTREQADTHSDFGGKHMIKRLGEPAEIAKAILFLASDDASFITAECLMVDGGYAAM
ncbi:MAG: glucose 1-dehydrogenase [Planctomycetota bacterium]|nr:glucose 1-dehydrogenase [Planctomycetota bacterium]MDA1214875.1 glucose 1-dehydrogenase [Planctomycetota bacterium]